MIRLCLFVWFCQLIVSAAYGQEARLAPHVAARLQAAAQAEVDAKLLPTLSLAIIDRGQTVASICLACGDPKARDSSKIGRQSSAPLDATTRYRVGSVSKLLTDMAVMQQVEAGRLKLDAPITDVLPDFRPRNPFGGAITLRQLMSHTAGLVREPPVGHYFDATYPTLDATVRSLNDTTLVYAPGSRTKYSNAGLAVAGAAVQAVTGQPFSDYVRERILVPLGMRHSSFELTDAIQRRLAPHTMWTLEGRRFPAPLFLLGTAPAGNLMASVEDLARFVACLHRGGQGIDAAGSRSELLSPASLAAMYRPTSTSDGQATSYGLGFRLQSLDGHRMIGHGGAVYGCATQVSVLPDDELGVVAATSLDCANTTVTRLCTYALRLMLADRQHMPLPEYEHTDAVPAERAQSLLGRYRHEQSAAEIFEVAGRLFLRHGQLQAALRQRPDGQLVVDDVHGFGTPVQLNASQELEIGSTVYQRLADEVPAAPKGDWLGLIGRYGWDHNELVIYEDQGQLMALIEWFFIYPLTELSKDEYAFPEQGLYHGETIVFRRDKSGNAIAAVTAGIPFGRRDAPGAAQTFKIQPLRPIDELREAARRAQPPGESGQFLPADLVELTRLNASVKLDIRYATTNNFAGAVFYSQPRAFLQRPAAQAVLRIHERLQQRGYGLLIHDAYRPWAVTKMFWDATPDSMKDFVANPANGSRHNRGCAVDLTLYELATGQPVEMVSGYDEFSPRAYPGYLGGTSQQRWHRELLRRAMQADGFSVYEFEWWHFDYQDWKKYRIGNIAFEELN